MRALLIAVVLVLGLGGTAEARRGGGIVIIVSGDAIEHVRDLSAEQTAALGYGKLGYHYQRFGVFWLDLWRDSGEFVVYSGDTYVPLTDEELEVLGGGSVPWRYHLPEGLIILAAVGYYFLIGRRKRRVKTAFILGGAFAVVSLVFFVKGLTWEFMIPLAIALHHGLTAWAAMRRGDSEDEVDTGEVVDEEPPLPRAVAVTAPRTSSPRTAVGTPAPARPSQPSEPSRPSQPLVIPPAPIARPTTAPAPMRHDDSVDGPKLLR